MPNRRYFETKRCYMFTLRAEVSSYIRACEHLISAVSTMQGKAKLTADECEMVAHYTDKVSKLTEPATADASHLDL